jgi:hypothetical protein
LAIADMLRAIPDTFWGIVLGSLFTIIGVVLTNASNTRRLRLQHEHEQNLESRERDLRLRRDIYLDAVEAISAGMAVVGRFGELHVPYRDLEQSYATKVPAIAKVTIVGHDDTIQAVADFSQALTGALQRLTSQRQRVDALMARSNAVDARVERAAEEQERILSQIQGVSVERSEDDAQSQDLRRRHAMEDQRLERLRAEQYAIGNEMAVALTKLIQQSVQEVANLDRLFVPVISLMRSELGLAFNEACYTQVIESVHRKQATYLEQFTQDVAPDVRAGLEDTR